MKEEDDEPTLSRVERSLRLGYWYFPLEPTSEEICAALRARLHDHYEDGYPANLVHLNRFFVMHKVGYRNGKGVKLEGWKTYDDHLMTKTSSGPLNGNDSLVLRIFALRPIIKGVEPIKLCWVKELSKGHQSGRRKKCQPDENNTKRITIMCSPYIKNTNLSSTAKLSAPRSHSPNNHQQCSPSASSIPSSPSSSSSSPPFSSSPLASASASPSSSSPALPGLHVTLAELAVSLAPIHLPPLDVLSSSSSLRSISSFKHNINNESDSHYQQVPSDASSIAFHLSDSRVHNFAYSNSGDNNIDVNTKKPILQSNCNISFMSYN